MNLFQISLADPSAEHSIELTLDQYIHEKSDGFGIPPVSRHFENTPSQHGSIDRGFHLLPRRLTFEVILRSENPDEYYALRSEIIAVLRPHLSSTPSTLFFTLPDSSIWTLSVFCTDLNFIKKTGFVQAALFSLTAPDPVYIKYAPPVQTTFVQAEINTSKSIAYPGTWLVQPNPFSIRGPITHPVIRNLTTNTKLDLDCTILDNQVVLIDLRQAYKTIRQGSTSLLGFLSSESHLETFALLPAPEAPAGVNVIQVTGSNTGANTRVSISFTPTRLAI